ncbi:hypothetical protein [Thermomonospora umbrina]|uniref:hypothetical protein n=1 Tax=Thermomonospora umbrina TaxID=111806 RepID=UPI000E26436E|nr:hypothetical protein [Thermomonospora umbrina]
MSHPPEIRGYEIHYTLGERGTFIESFADEFTLMEWFGGMTRRGLFDPEGFEMPDEDGRNGYRILCLTDDGRVPISYLHPRMVRARIEATPPLG